MKFFDARQVAAALPYNRLIPALERAFKGKTTAPPRAHHRLPQHGGSEASLLLMPAWNDAGGLGVKIATVFPDNALKQQKSVNAIYCLMDGSDGSPLAVFDGEELTLRRTAAASALASRYLSREDSAGLLMVGSGSLAPYLIEAHSSVRPIERVSVWGRTTAKAEALAETLHLDGVETRPVTDLDAALQEVDIVSCATLSNAPLVKGKRLKSGQHLDLVGAYLPSMREADGEAVRRAAVYVDTYGGAESDAGDLLQAQVEGVFEWSDIRGDLKQLATGAVPGRESDHDITLFKSVGTALEDLAAAELLVARAGKS